MGEPCERGPCSAAAGMKEGADGEPWDTALGWLEGAPMGNRSNASAFLQLLKNINLERADGMQGDSSDVLRIVISLVYSVVCALGLVGNLLVLYLMKSKQGWRKSSINLFVTSLAVTDFQFVLTLPFWAVENALDFNWLFGKAMCKIVSYVTAMNMYASVFFLTAMSVARYRSVASALKNQRRGDPLGGCCSAKWLCALIWLSAILASLPQAIFSTTATVFDDVLCLVKFPEGRGSNAQFWLGLYQIQKVLLGFVLPLAIISLCYLLLVRFISDKHVGSTCSGPSTKRRSKVTKSVSIVVLSFFLCWLPNQALTTWGILIKLNVHPGKKGQEALCSPPDPYSICFSSSVIPSATARIQSNPNSQGEIPGQDLQLHVSRDFYYNPGCFLTRKILRSARCLEKNSRSELAADGLLCKDAKTLGEGGKIRYIHRRT
uniref:G-protein coupled receptors family 1 profile domain-containing protein n=1 Tax=Anas zonorhyncha TaxID=75864 RepID=A0A8B9ZUQ8_9AVES